MEKPKNAAMVGKSAIYHSVQTNARTPPRDTRKKLGVGMLGYAFMGKAHTNAFRQIPFFFPDSPIPRLVAISGRSESRVRDVATRYGYERYYTDWHELVNDDEIDVLDNGLPNNFHKEPCILAAEKGKNIICEKPLGLNVKESEEMLRAVKKAGVKHMVGYNYRFLPAIRLAKELIDQGYIGKILQFRAAYLQEWIMNPDFPLVWRLKRSEAGSGVLGDLGSHVIDLARFLVGNVDSTVSMMKTFIEKRLAVSNSSEEITSLKSNKKTGAKTGKVDVDDAFIALVKFNSGSIGSIEASRFCAGRKNFSRIEVHGSEGSLSFNLERLNELQVYSNRDLDDRRGFKTISVTESIHPYYKHWWPQGHVLGWEHTFIHEMYHFFSAVEKDKPIDPWGATFYDGLAVDKIIGAIVKSTETSRWEMVN
jgi:predicted dehydrogenase